MKLCDSCNEAIEKCLSNQNFAISYLSSSEKSKSIHIHDCYEIYYSIRGGNQFIIDNQCYAFGTGDIFFINQYESHFVSQYDFENHERIVITIHPKYLNTFSTEATNLSYCFHFRNHPESHRLSLKPDEQAKFMNYYHSLTSSFEYGQDIIDISNFLKLMVFLNTIYKENFSKSQLLRKNDTISFHNKANAIMAYINQNLENDLSADSVARHFNYSKSYLNAIFKNSTGNTLNRYVEAQRIALAKRLISQGISLMDVSQKSGFNDYSTFFRAFSKAVGISPRDYLKKSLK